MRTAALNEEKIEWDLLTLAIVLLEMCLWLDTTGTVSNLAEPGCLSQSDACKLGEFHIVQERCVANFQA